jgi:hypothetical protein
MAGLDPAIYALRPPRKAWMPGSSPGMTIEGSLASYDSLSPGHAANAAPATMLRQARTSLR